MKIVSLFLLIVGFCIIFSVTAGGKPLLLPQEERRLRNIRQLTFGGKNAEAYFSFDGTKLIFQATRDGFQCDQIFLMDVEKNDIRLLSTGKGQTTCAYFFPDGRRIVYSSTHHIRPDCLPRPPREKRYVWSLHP